MQIRSRLGGEAKTNTGGALLMALITVMSVGMLMAAYLSHSSAVTRRQAHSIELKQSFYLAEAGLAESFAGLAIGKTGNVGTEANPALFGQGVFWVEATDLDDTQVQLNSTAMVGQTRAELSLVAERGDVSVASLGIFGGEGVTVEPGSIIDAFDSEIAPYSPKATVGLARIGSNGPIQLSGTAESPTSVVADVFAGPKQPVTMEGTVLHLGETGSAMTATELPPVAAPSIEVETGIVHSGEAPLVIPEGTRGLETLRISSNAEVVIQGPAELLIGQLVIEPGGSLEIDASSGAVDLWVDEKLDMQAGSSVVTSARDTAAVSLQVVGALAEPVNLAATSAFHGMIYAPETDVEVTSGFEVYGSLVGKTLTFTGAASLHFDAYLERFASRLALPEMISWRILRLSTDADVFGTGDDPFEILGVSRAALDGPADSHQDQTLSISYLDGGSMLRTYTGAESAFDWTDVSVPLDVSRDGKTVVDIGPAKSPGSPGGLQSAVDQLIGSAASSSELRDGLLAASPLADLSLTKIIQEPNLLSSSHLGTVLEATPNLSDAVMLAAIADDTLSSSDMKDLLLANSPLSTAVRDAVSSRTSVTMNGSDLTTILAQPAK